MAQAGLAKRLTYKGNLTEVYDLPPPIASMDPASAAYKAQADEVLSVSANLTDSNKMQARPPSILIFPSTPSTR